MKILWITRDGFHVKYVSYPRVMPDGTVLHYVEETFKIHLNSSVFAAL